MDKANVVTEMGMHFTVDQGKGQVLKSVVVVHLLQDDVHPPFGNQCVQPLLETHGTQPQTFEDGTNRRCACLVQSCANRTIGFVFAKAGHPKGARSVFVLLTIVAKPGPECQV